MSFLARLFGSAAAEPINAIANIVDSVYTSEGEKLDKETMLARVGMQPRLVTLEIAKVEAQHRSIFVAGARPFILWVCGAGIAYGFVIRDLLAWGLRIFAPEVEAPPELALEAIMGLTTSVLGLGAFRTVEKLAGRTK